MSYRTRVSRVAVVTLAVAGVALAPMSAQATEAPAKPTVSTANATAQPCPLTDAQLASGRQVVARAVRTLDAAEHLTGTAGGGGLPPVTASPLDVGDLQRCLLAVEDARKKAESADFALARFTACLADSFSTGASCTAEAGNLRTAASDLEVALSNMRMSCPWLAFF